MAIWNGKALMAARQKKRWTQEELSKATKPEINISTISRIERGKQTRARERTLKELSRALGVASESLCTTKEAERDVMKQRVRPAARNALALVADRYKLAVNEVVEIAPLLFFIVAEQSLQERKNRIKDVRDSAASLRKLYGLIPQLPACYPLDEGAVSSEERSIEARDLFGTVVGVANDSGQFVEDYDHDYDDEEQNPFVAFLRDSLIKLSNSQAADTVRWTPGLWPSYRICTEEAGAIVGGDKAATDMILCGDVALHDLLKIALEERVERAQAQYLQKYGRSYSDHMRVVADALGLPPDAEIVS
jgi:transcriptional regulator with XRE-family HTH domain